MYVLFMFSTVDIMQFSSLLHRSCRLPCNLFNTMFQYHKSTNMYYVCNKKQTKHNK